MTCTDIVVEVMLEGLRLQLLDGAGGIESLRAFRRALLTVEAAPQPGLDDRLQMLLGALAARVGNELFRFDKGKWIEEVVLIQRVFIALGDAGSAEDAACVFFILVEVLGGLEAARFCRELVLWMEGGLYLLRRAYFGSQSTIRSRMTRKLPRGSIVSTSL